VLQDARDAGVPGDLVRSVRTTATTSASLTQAKSSTGRTTARPTRVGRTLRDLDQRCLDQRQLSAPR
jgi:hypothetical protein